METTAFTKADLEIDSKILDSIKRPVIPVSREFIDRQLKCNTEHLRQQISARLKVLWKCGLIEREYVKEENKVYFWNTDKQVDDTWVPDQRPDPIEEYPQLNGAEVLTEVHTKEESKSEDKNINARIDAYLKKTPLETIPSTTVTTSEESLDKRIVSLIKEVKGYITKEQIFVVLGHPKKSDPRRKIIAMRLSNLWRWSLLEKSYDSFSEEIYWHKDNNALVGFTAIVRPPKLPRKKKEKHEIPTEAVVTKVEQQEIVPEAAVIKYETPTVYDNSSRKLTCVGLTPEGLLNMVWADGPEIFSKEQSEQIFKFFALVDSKVLLANLTKKVT